jgi:hypothetical protein
MAADLAQVKDALEGLTDIELRALRLASSRTPRMTSGLRWIQAACDWEISRRLGRSYDLRAPNAAMDPSEAGLWIDAVTAMRTSFASGEAATAVLKFLDAVAALFAAHGWKP